MDNTNNDTDHESEHTSNNNHMSNAGSSKISAKRARISRACDTCRRKKIKCDVDSRNPCSTCVQYNWECTFNDTTKKRGPPKGYIESLENRLEKMESLLKNLASDDDVVISYATRQNLDEEARARLKHRSKYMRYHGSSSGYHLVGDMFQTNSDQDSVKEDGEEEQQPLYVVRSFNGKPDYRMRRVNSDGDDFMVVRDATADEIAAQQAEDTLETIDDLVPRSVLTALIYTFFTDAHTALSVVDKQNYLDAFEGRTTPPPAPLLTYAICTYACFLLKASDPIFQEAKVERDNVFQVLLERATSLVRKEYLKPRIVTIQALVLLCAHPTYSTSSYRNWILAGMAVRMAQDLGLHRTLTTVELSKRGQERKKHLWHSVYVTDRWCCAVMGRPLAIADSDCDVDLPLIHGYDGNSDYTMFVNFIKLSGILGEVLRRIYSPKAKLNGYKTKAIEQTVYSLERVLDDWFLNVPEKYKVTENDLKQMKANPNLYPEDSRKVTEGGPLTVCYHAVVLLLHRPFIVLEDGDHSSIVDKALELCRNSAKQSIEIARSIPYMAIAKFGWNFAAYSVFQAALIHVYNCTSSNSDIAKEAKEYVNICIEECLGPLSKDIPAGPPLIPFLQNLSSLLENKKDAPQGQQAAHHHQQQQQPQPQPMPYQSIFQDASSIPTQMPHANNQPFLGGLGGMPSQSWLLSGPGNTPALSHTAWQQLFSSAGAPFREEPEYDVDTQGIAGIFMGNQPNNFYM